MGHGIYTAAAGAVARRTQLDITANNLANATSTGYREQRVAFEGVLADVDAPTRHMVAVGRPMVSRDRGPIHRTDRQLDVTVQGEGFFVATDSGGAVLLRTVSMHLDSDGALRDPAGRMISLAGGHGWIEPGVPVTVDEHGRILQRDAEVARLLAVDVIDSRGLSPVGDGGYIPTPASGQPFPISANVVSGAIEQSNVQPVANMTKMISLERDYQALTRVIHAYREADQGILEAATNR